MKLRIILSFLFIAGLFFLILHTVDIEKLVTLLFSFPKSTLVLLLFLSFSMSLLKTLRFYLLLQNAGIAVSFLTTLKVYLAGQAISPFPGGEAARAVMLRKETGVALSQISGTIVTQAFLEFLSAALLAVVGSFLLQRLQPVAFILALFISCILFFFIHKTLIDHIVHVIKFFPFTHGLVHHLLIMHFDVRRNLVKKGGYRPHKIFFSALCISFGITLIGALLLMIIAGVYETPFTVGPAIFTYAATMVLTGFAAFIPGGLGLTEGGMTGIVLFFVPSFTIAFAIVLIFRLVTFVFHTLLGLLLLTTFYGKSLYKKKHI